MADALDLDLVEPEGGRDGLGHLDDEGGVLAGVAVALEEGGRERLDDVRLGAEGVDAALGGTGCGAGAAVGAGAIEAAGGGGQQALDRRAGAVRRDAGRDGDEARARDLAAVELGDEPLAAGARAAQARGGHEDGDLVGARAADHVGLAREAAQALGDGQQGRVAGRWAAARVERAEVVDVDERQRGWLLGAPGVGEDRLGVAAEGVEGEHAGAGVDAGAVGHLGLEALEPGAGIRQRAAQLMTIAPKQHDRVIGRL